MVSIKLKSFKLIPINANAGKGKENIDLFRREHVTPIMQRAVTVALESARFWRTHTVRSSTAARSKRWRCVYASILIAHECVRSFYAGMGIAQQEAFASKCGCSELQQKKRKETS